MSTAPEIPFVADGTYRVSATIHPLGPPRGRESGHLRRDELAPIWLSAKLDALVEGAWSCRAARFVDARGTRLALDRLAAVVATENPDVLGVGPGFVDLHTLGLRLSLIGSGLDADVARTAAPAPGYEDLSGRALAWLDACPAELRLADALAFAIQEDYAVIALDEGRDHAELLHVCLPSGWSAVDKIGQNFAEIHGPVPHNEPLVRAHPGMVEMVTTRGPFVRYVWGMHRDSELCHDPNIHTQPAELERPTPEEAVNTSFYRVERQTLFAVPEVRRAVFTIRTWVAPLREVITTRERAQRMAGALRDMTDELAVYKGLVRRRPALVEWLDAAAARLPDA